MSTRHIGDVSPCRSAAPIHQVARLHRAAGGRGRQATGVARLFCAHAWMTPGITVPFFACTPPTAAAALPQGLSLFVTFCRVVAVICQSRAKDPLDPSLAPMSKNGNNQTHTQRQCQSANHFSSATDNVPTCFTSPRVATRVRHPRRDRPFVVAAPWLPTGLLVRRLHQQLGPALRLAAVAVAVRPARSRTRPPPPPHPSSRPLSCPPTCASIRQRRRFGR